MKNNETETPQTPFSLPRWGWLIVAALLLILIVFFASQSAGASRALLPFVPTNTPLPPEFAAETIPVNFPDLQAEPGQYLFRRIRVSGTYTRPPLPECDRTTSGPLIRWALVADDLQMNGRGLEPLLRLVPEGTTVTIEGVWRRYRGPLGCGKEPETGTVWYLAAERIVQPNPLPLPGTPLPQPGERATPTLVGTRTPTPQGGGPPETPDPALFTPTSTPTFTPTPSLTPTPDGAPMETPDGTATVTPTADETAVSTPATPTPTVTGTPPTPTPTDPAAPGATPTPGGQPPPLPTATSGDPYPVATPTDAPPGGYP